MYINGYNTKYLNKSLDDFYLLEIKDFFIDNNKIIEQKKVLFEGVLASLFGNHESFFNEFYNIYDIKKRNGSYRKIEAPVFKLKYHQRKLADFLNLNRKRNLDVSFGFEKGLGIVEGANKHINHNVIINLDIKDFFKSISKEMVGNMFEKHFSNSKYISEITELVIYDKYLPTGAPTSPIITNFICEQMDLELHDFSIKNNLNYTRYVDDLTFSTNEKIRYKSIIKKIETIVKKYGFELNENKSKIYRKAYRQEVTGLVVNNKVNLKREFRYNLKAILYNWENKGYLIAKEQFKNKYRNKDFLQTLKGWINFFGVVKGKQNSDYIRFINKFNFLYNKTKPLQ